MLASSSRSVSKTVLWLFLMLVGFATGAWGQADVQGQWSTLNYSMTINPIHVALMHNGKILVVTGSGNCPPSQSGCPSGPPYNGSNSSGAVVLDPVAKSITQLSVNWDMFCNSMTVLADGRVMVAGGTISYDPFFGIQKTSLFDPAANTFTDVQSMAHGRWYPTVTLLSDGRVMVFSGWDETNATNKTVEIYTAGSGWSQQYTASWTPPLYPRQHLLPNGNVFVSGPASATYTFNPSNQTWSALGNTNLGATRTYGSSVLLPLTPANGYDPKVLILGGGGSPTATTELIDLGTSSPAWAWGPSMSQPRIEMDAVILPTGKILATGGSASDENAATASLNADLYDPATNSFSSAGSNTYARLYHSVALLLPDATVWTAGGNPGRGTWEPHMEIYQPAYLFTRDINNNVVAATRPTIASAPSNIGWGGAFAVSTPDAANISQVVLVRPGSSTHAFDMDQRLVGMAFTAGSGTLTVTAPPNSKIAPPGHYMLFLVNNKGVPSVASFVLLNSSGSNPAPTVSSISPTSGTASGGTPVTITGTGFLAGATVKLGGTAATGVTVVSSTSITATTPAHTAGAVDVVVTNTDAQSGTLSGGYTYTSSGGGGGIGFVQVKSATATSGSSIAATYTSAQTAGNLNVIAVMWGDITSSVSSVTDSKGNTYALAIGPTRANGLSSAIYYAKNIAAGSNTVTVTFNQSAGWPNVNAMEYSGLDTATPLDVVAAASGSGTTANSGSATTTSANELIVGAGNPVTTFTAAGSGFTSRIINSFGGISEDKIVTSTGSYNATATMTSGGWVMQMAAFRASGQGGSNPAPTVSTILPATGTAAGGTAVTITGTGFLAGATVKLGGTAATNVVVGSSTSITATTPAHAAGAVSVVVTNTDSQSGTLTNGYTYTNPAPTVSTISPTSGTTSGGTAVTITGTGFLSGGTVSLGGTAATGVTVVSSTSITATTPAHAAGAVNVVVTNTDSQSGTLSNGYTYTSGNPAPTVSSISPTSGTTSGGTPATITGTGFLSGATVKLGGTAATGVTVVSSTSITATTPAHTAGAVDVVVTNTDAQSGTLSGGYTYTSASGGSISFVQVKSAVATSGSSIAATYTAAQTAGNLNVIAVMWGDTTSSVSSVTDSKGNTYALAVGVTRANGLSSAIYYAKNIAAGSNTVTVTFNQAAGWPNINVMEYSGLSTTSPLDVTATASGTGTTANSGSATTTAANELIVGAGNPTSVFTAAGSGFSNRIINSFGGISEDRIVTSTGSYNATATMTTGGWVMQMATFKP